MKRVLTALALIPIVVWVVLFANQWIFLGVLALVSCLCYREYDTIAGGFGFGRPGVIGYGAGLAILVWWDVPWLLIVGLTMAALVVARSHSAVTAVPRSNARDAISIALGSTPAI